MGLGFLTLLLCAELEGGGIADVYLLFKLPSLFSEVPNVGFLPVSTQNKAK